jgi:putative sterol carrier protein
MSEKYLSQEWLDSLRSAAASQPERPGATARLQYVVSGGPDGDVKYYWVLEDGKLLESALGTIDDADVTLTLTYEDSVKVQQGELDANAAFMQGRMKVAGNMAKLMQLLPITSSPEYKAAQAEVTANTTF